MNRVNMSQQVLTELTVILERAKSTGLSDRDIEGCLEQEGLVPTQCTPPLDLALLKIKAWSLMDILVFKIYPILFLAALVAYPGYKAYGGSPCLVSDVFPLTDAVAPFVDCKVCKGVSQAPRLTNISQEEFICDYAYQSKPVLVVGAANDWPAMDLFSYDYFKKLYSSKPDSQGDAKDRQFFAYKSGMVNDLEDLFAMSSEKLSTGKEKWYIGW